MRREMRQNIKKLTSLILAAAMVLGMNSTVFAAEANAGDQKEDVYVIEETEVDASVEELDEAESAEEEIAEVADEESVEAAADDELIQEESVQEEEDPEGKTFEEIFAATNLGAYLSTFPCKVDDDGNYCYIDTDRNGYLTEAELADVKALYIGTDSGEGAVEALSNDLNLYFGDAFPSLKSLTIDGYKDKGSYGTSIPRTVECLNIQNCEFTHLNVKSATGLTDFTFVKSAVRFYNGYTDSYESNISGLSDLKKLKNIDIENGSTVTPLELNLDFSEIRPANEISVKLNNMTGWDIDISCKSDSEDDVLIIDCRGLTDSKYKETNPRYLRYFNIPRKGEDFKGTVYVRCDSDSYFASKKAEWEYEAWKGLEIDDPNLFPDEAFREYLKNYTFLDWNDEETFADTDRNGYISDDEMDNYSDFDIKKQRWSESEGKDVLTGAEKIRSLKGIENITSISYLNLEGLTLSEDFTVPEAVYGFYVNDSTVKGVDFTKCADTIKAVMFSRNTYIDGVSGILNDIENNLSSIEYLFLDRWTLSEEFTVPATLRNFGVNNSTVNSLDFTECISTINSVRLYENTFTGDPSNNLKNLNMTTNLNELHVYRCSGIKELTTMGKLLQGFYIVENPDLERFNVKNFSSVGDYDYGNDVIGLEVHDNPKLEELSFAVGKDYKEAYNDNRVDISGNSSLKKLDIKVPSCEIDLRGVTSDFNDGEDFNIDIEDSTGQNNVKVYCDEGSWIANNSNGNYIVEAVRVVAKYLTMAIINKSVYRIGDEIEANFTFKTEERKVCNPEFEVISSDPDCVSYDAENKKFIAVGAGSAVITIRTTDGEFERNVTVYVLDNVTSISLDKASANFTVGSNTILKATVNPKTNVIADVWWHIYNSEGDEVATPEGFSIKKVNSAGGVSTATISVAKDVPAGKYTVVANSMSNYDNGIKYVEGESNYISAECELTAAPAYKVAVDKNTLYYGTASDSKAKITVSNIVNASSVSMKLIDPADRDDVDPFDGCLTLTPDANNNAIWYLTFNGGKSEKEVLDAIIANPNVNVEITADNSKTEIEFFAYALNVSAKIGSDMGSNIFAKGDVVSKDINTNSKADYRLVEVNVYGNKGKATVTCDNPDIGTFTYDAAKGVAKLQVTKNVTGTANIVIKADGRQKTLTLDLYKKNKYKAFNDVYDSEYTVYVEYGEDGKLHVAQDQGNIELNGLVNDYYGENGIQYTPDVVSTLNDGYWLIGGHSISEVNSTNGNYTISVRSVTDVASTGDDEVKFFVTTESSGIRMRNNSTGDYEYIDIPDAEIEPIYITIKTVGRMKAADSNAVLKGENGGIINKGNNSVVGYAILNNKKNMTIGDVDLGNVVDGDQTLGTWSWVNPSEVLKANASMPIQFFAAEFTPADEGKYKDFEPIYCALPVAVSQITGMTIYGDAYVEKDVTGTWGVDYKGTGYLDANGDSDFNEALNNSLTYTWKTDDTKGLITPDSELNKDTVKMVSNYEGSSDSKFKLTVEAVDKQSKKISAAATVILAAKSVIGDITVAIPGDTSAYDYDPDDADNDGFVESWEVSESDLSLITGIITLADKAAGRIAKKNTTTITLDVKTDGQDTAKLIDWTSSDTSVATVKENADGDIDVTILKKSGSAVIRGIAKDAGKATVELYVDNRDYAPVLTSKTFTLNYNSETLVLPFVVPNGNAFKDGTSFVDTDENDPFEPITSKKITVEGKVYYPAIGVKTAYANKEAFAVVNGKSVKRKVKVSTIKGDYIYEITIKGNNADPKITFSQKDKARIFELDDEIDKTFSFKLGSSYTIKSVDVENEFKWDGGTDKYSYESLGYDPVTQMVYLKYHNITRDISDSHLKQPITLEVEFEGLATKYYIDTPNVSVGYGVPTVAAPVKLEYLKEQTGDKTFTFIPKDKKGNTIDILNSAAAGPDSVYLDKASIKAGFKDPMCNGDGSFSITYTGNKSDKFTLNVICNDAYYDFPISGTVAAVKTKELALGSSKLTINTNTNDKAFVETEIFIKNDETLPIEGLAFGTDKNSRSLVESGFIDINYYDGRINIRQNNKVDAPKPGTYKIIFRGKVDVGGQLVDAKSVTLSLVVSNKAPTVTVKTSGTINPLDRENSTVVVTPTAAEISSKVNYFRMNSDMSAYFNAYYDNDAGTVVISANSGAVLAEKEYKIGGQFYLEDGTVINWDGNTKGQYIPVKVKQVNPKLVISKFTNILYKADKGSYVEIPVANDKGYAFDYITFEGSSNELKCYDKYDLNGNKMVVVQLVNDSEAQYNAIKPGSYKLNIQVYFKNAALGAAPMKYTTSIVVK